MRKMSPRSQPDDLARLEERAVRAERLTKLAEHPGWQELMDILDQAQELYDRQILAQLRTGTLTQREMFKYEDTMRAYRLFRQNPERAAKELETALGKVKRAQPEKEES